jgi:hypothetical protein
MRTGKNRLPRVKRLAVKVSPEEEVVADAALIGAPSLIGSLNRLAEIISIDSIPRRFNDSI